MGSDLMLWAGKPLSEDEAAAARRLVALLGRVGRADDAANLARFLPESEHRWTPDELELGAHVGPWLGVEGRLAAD